MAIAFPPSPSISLTTDAAASAPFVYVMATFAPSAARRLAIAAPIPRDPPVMSAIFPSSFLDIAFLLFFEISLSGDPIADVGRTVKETYTFFLTGPQEANDIYIDEAHFLQVQHNL